MSSGGLIDTTGDPSPRPPVDGAAADAAADASDAASPGVDRSPTISTLDSALQSSPSGEFPPLSAEEEAAFLSWAQAHQQGFVPEAAAAQHASDSGAGAEQGGEGGAEQETMQREEEVIVEEEEGEAEGADEEAREQAGDSPHRSDRESRNPGRLDALVGGGAESPSEDPASSVTSTPAMSRSHQNRARGPGRSPNLDRTPGASPSSPSSFGFSPSASPSSSYLYPPTRSSGGGSRPGTEQSQRYAWPGSRARSGGGQRGNSAGGLSSYASSSPSRRSDPTGSTPSASNAHQAARAAAHARGQASSPPPQRREAGVWTPPDSPPRSPSNQHHRSPERIGPMVFSSQQRKWVQSAHEVAAGNAFLLGRLLAIGHGDRSLYDPSHGQRPEGANQMRRTFSWNDSTISDLVRGRQAILKQHNALERQRRNRRIEEENARLAARIAAATHSRSVDPRVHARDFARHERYRGLRSVFRHASPSSSHPGGGGGKGSELEHLEHTGARYSSHEKAQLYSSFLPAAYSSGGGEGKGTGTSLPGGLKGSSLEELERVAALLREQTGHGDEEEKQEANELNHSSLSSSSSTKRSKSASGHSPSRRLLATQSRTHALTPAAVTQMMEDVFFAGREPLPPPSLDSVAGGKGSLSKSHSAATLSPAASHSGLAATLSPAKLRDMHVAHNEAAAREALKFASLARGRADAIEREKAHMQQQGRSKKSLRSSASTPQLSSSILAGIGRPGSLPKNSPLRSSGASSASRTPSRLAPLREHSSSSPSQSRSTHAASGMPAPSPLERPMTGDSVRSDASTLSWSLQRAQTNSALEDAQVASQRRQAQARLAAVHSGRESGAGAGEELSEQELSLIEERLSAARAASAHARSGSTGVPSAPLPSSFDGEESEAPDLQQSDEGEEAEEEMDESACLTTPLNVRSLKAFMRPVNSSKAQFVEDEQETTTTAAASPTAAASH